MAKRSQKLRYLLRGGATGTISVSPDVAAQLADAIVNAIGHIPRFVTFNAERSRVLLNLEHLVMCRFYPPYRPSRTRRHQHSESEIKLFHSDDDRPLILHANPTARSSRSRRFEYSTNYFAKIADGDFVHFIQFDDLDREKTFIRADDATLVLIPLATLVAEGDAVRS